MRVSSSIMSRSGLAITSAKLKTNCNSYCATMNTIQCATSSFARAQRQCHQQRHFLTTAPYNVPSRNRQTVSPVHYNAVHRNEQHQLKLRLMHQQYRCMGRFSGGSMSEEYYISTAFKKLDTKQPKIIVHCERVQLVGCNLLPRAAQKIIERANVRFRVITHADTVSLDVLKHQIAFVEEQERRNFPNSQYPTAVFAMNLATAESVKLKQMKTFADAIFGASSIVKGSSPILVCGIPNSGKSSLVLALTRARTMKVKNKREYHLPKVSVQAGRTLGTKSHIMEYDSKNFITFMDSPGLRPRLEGLNPDTIRLLLASKSVEPFKGYAVHTTDQILLRLLLQAANNYSSINYAVGKILHERKKPTSQGVQEYAPPTLPDYATAFGLDACTDDPNVFVNAYYKTSNEKQSNDPLHFVRKFQSGDFGSWLFTPYRRDVLTDNNIGAMRDFNHGHLPIIYMNQAAKEYMSKASEFGVVKTVLKKQRAAENQMSAKADNRDIGNNSGNTTNGDPHSKKNSNKANINDEELARLDSFWR